jgi:DNA-binding GntR family transcriptional regulator
MSPLPSRAARAPGPHRYVQLADRLLGDIRSGKLKVGDTLPGELALVGEFGVSRHTVREALRRLEDIGLIDRSPGIGTVVRARDGGNAFVLQARSPAELVQYPPGSRLEIRGRSHVEASRALARRLQCAPGESWFRIEALRRVRARGAVLCVTEIYLRPEYARVIAPGVRHVECLYELVERRFGERAERVGIEVDAGALSEAQASALGLAAGAPSLDVTRRFFGRAGRVFEVSVSHHPAGRYTYSCELRRSWRADGAWSAR